MSDHDRTEEGARSAGQSPRQFLTRPRLRAVGPDVPPLASAGELQGAFLVARDDDRAWMRVVRNLDRRLVREMGYAQELGAHWDEAWIWGGTAPYGSHWGVAAFQESYSGWLLARIYLLPHMRRRGCVRAAWPTWRERYGDFRVDRPSDAMQAFLSGVGYAPVPPLIDGLPSHEWAPVCGDGADATVIVKREV